MSFSDVVTDRENLPFGIEQEFEIRFIDQSPALGRGVRNLFEIVRAGSAACSRATVRAFNSSRAASR
jgi:hypothetical protein